MSRARACAAGPPHADDVMAAGPFPWVAGQYSVARIAEAQNRCRLDSDLHRSVGLDDILDSGIKSDFGRKP